MLTPIAIVREKTGWVLRVEALRQDGPVFIAAIHGFGDRFRYNRVFLGTGHAFGAGRMGKRVVMATGGLVDGQVLDIRAGRQRDYYVWQTGHSPRLLTIPDSEVVRRVRFYAEHRQWPPSDLIGQPGLWLIQESVGAIRHYLGRES